MDTSSMSRINALFVPYKDELSYTDTFSMSRINALFVPYKDEFGLQPEGKYDFTQVLNLTSKIEPAQEYPITYSMCKMKVPNIVKKHEFKRAIYIEKFEYMPQLAKYAEENFYAEIRSFENENIEHDVILMPWPYKVKVSRANSWLKKYIDLVYDSGVIFSNHFDYIKEELIDFYEEELL